VIKGIFHQFSKHRHIIGKFRQTGAFSVNLSKSIRDLGLEESVVFRKLIRQGVIVHAGSRTYFLDEQQWLRHRMNRVKWGMIALFVVLLMVFVWFF
jgi:hypothetical protein